MPEIFNVGIVGYGLSAKVFHIPLVLTVPTLRLSAIVQQHPQPKDDAEKDHPGIKSYRSIEAMLQDEDVHLIVLTTIPETHSPLAKLALNAGKHVVVEKPFTPTTAEADELIALAKEKSRLLTVYQNRRWDSDFLTVLHLLKSGRLGRVVDFESHFDRHRPEVPADGVTWKTKVIPGSGAAYDLGTHLIDQVVVALGMPKRITGFIGSQRKGETKGYEDSFVILMHYDEGLTATLKAAVVSPEVGQLRYWIRGERGSYKKVFSALLILTKDDV
ncbi:MAG: hypothetical protein M1825_001017 [Sarcosagium campestre]|nr:MAG: hypothetical protein M1825_001017 [Sarcosagium campestre]